MPRTAAFAVTDAGPLDADADETVITFVTSRVAADVSNTSPVGTELDTGASV